MSMDKYYTPKEEDFIIGLEFEYARPYKGEKTYHTEGKYKGKIKSKGKWLYEDWVPAKVNSFYNLAEVFWVWGDNLPEWDKTYRVKYLDKEDIESFGFEYDPNCTDLPELGFLEESKVFTEKTQYLLYFNPEKFKIRIERIFDCGTGEEDYLFNGIIKNKSELKKILQIIGVLKDE